MIAGFELSLAGRFVFSADRLAGLGGDVAALAGAAARVLVVSDAALRRAGLVARAEAALAREGHRVAVFSALAGEPAVSDIDAAAQAIREHDAAAVVALGGGSALDVGKLAAAIAGAGCSAADYALMASELPRRAIPLILVPTTAGTGSEATRTSVFALPDGRKVWAWGDALRADLALLDPLLTTGLPRPLTVATGIDALVHAIEAATARRSSPPAQAFALEAIRRIAAALPALVAAPEDVGLRGEMLVAACLAGLAIDHAGTGVAHAIGHALGTIGRVHHGRAVGHVLRVALPWNAEAALESHAAVALALGVPRDGGDAALAASAGETYAALLDRIGLPPSLADQKLGPADLERLVAASLAEENAPMRENNARKLAAADMERLSRAVLGA